MGEAGVGKVHRGKTELMHAIPLGGNSFVESGGGLGVAANSNRGVGRKRYAPARERSMLF